ncbi:hypothetical protein K470DRAFT_267056 [Piedraia hortae CBS 480.64]|uniref:Uncharacterized protein n=1 Tax=Piedraia hortae CBS 480.64 TaxID=1314780 RepID=A0A6A7BP69_9PEZI|nr:hypothetical protein K470DRAFT_267056 [Piedraia hortae CBS 480.64]
MARELRKADAQPDEVREAPEEAKSGVNANGSKRNAAEVSLDDKSPSTFAVEKADRDEGDDFDDFNQEDGDDDFGDFDVADEDNIPVPCAESRPLSTSAIASSISSTLDDLPSMHLSGCNTGEDIGQAIEPYLSAIFPDETRSQVQSEAPEVNSSNSSPFLSERSLSLWQQLISPPPIQPPNWTRSRTRRLFLVSLGVPVDLDEILPPSQQKRLVLPNINTSASRSSSTLERLKGSRANSSSTSLNSKNAQTKPSKRRRDPSPPPDFDSNNAALLCSTTGQAMSAFSDAELNAHVARLNLLTQEASSVLEYWQRRKNESFKEKEAFEGVIENLVGFVKGRKGK